MLNTYYDDLFKTECTTTIVNEKIENNQYHYVLDETLFYVKSGGMESDRGIVNAEQITDIYIEDNQVWHVFNNQLFNPIHICVDLNYRLFKSQIHTAQHLMCTIMNKDYHAKTIMFKTGESESEIEMAFSALNRDTLNAIEKKCNEFILQDLPVVISYPTKEEALANIWEDYGTDFNWDTQLRSVSIPGVDYDLCACIHVPSLRYLHAIKFLGFEKTTRGFKISFVAGQQLIDYMQHHFDVFHEAAKSLAVSQLDINESLQKLFQEKRELNASLSEYKQHYFDAVAKELSLCPQTYLFKEFEGLDTKSFQQLCSTITTQHEKGILFILKLDDKCHIVVAKHKSLPLFCNEIFKGISLQYNLKGGGNPSISQGGGLYTNELSTHCATLIDELQENANGK